MAMIARKLRRLGGMLALECLAVCVLLLAGTGVAAAAEAKGKPAAPKPSADAAVPQGIDDLKALETKARQVVAKVTPSVVSVEGGSGVVVRSDGYVLTVAHVAQRAGRNIMVFFPDGRRVRAVTLGNDAGVDAGMVKLSGPGPWPAVEMASSENLKLGQWCLTLGYPVTFERGARRPCGSAASCPTGGRRSSLTAQSWAATPGPRFSTSTGS